jgi:glyoxylase-like metal-dependent hydrolase (beta-lactamase superfamily II)
MADRLPSLKVHSLQLGLGCAYLLEFPRGMILVDCGSPGQEQRVMKLLKKLGRSDLRMICITHAHLDHYGSAAALRRLTGALVAIHRADAGAMARAQTNIGWARSYGQVIRWILPLAEVALRPEPVEADLLLDDGEDLGVADLKARVVHTPGHTLGSICLWVEDGLAFVGDLILSRGSPHVQQLYAQDWSQIPSSLARLQALHPEWVYPGHGRAPLQGGELQKLQLHNSPAR